jgi:hypothetical protein
MFKTIAATTLLILAVTVGANASSGKSWDALFAKASGTCIGKSGMVTPEASSPVVFEDSVGKVAILLRSLLAKERLRRTCSASMTSKPGALPFRNTAGSETDPALGSRCARMPPPSLGGDEESVTGGLRGCPLWLFRGDCTLLSLSLRAQL